MLEDKLRPGEIVASVERCGGFLLSYVLCRVCDDLQLDENLEGEKLMGRLLSWLENC
jgi:hypothetical protein